MFFQPCVFQTSLKKCFLPLFFRRVREPPEGGAICLGRVGEEVRGHQQEVGGLAIILVFYVIVFVFCNLTCVCFYVFVRCKEVGGLVIVLVFSVIVFVSL